jgi:hypothetical protein
MAGQNLDVVGTAAVDVVPIAPNFHNRLSAIVLPGADRIGDELASILHEPSLVVDGGFLRAGVSGCSGDGQADGPTVVSIGRRVPRFRRRSAARWDGSMLLVSQGWVGLVAG